MFQSLLCEGRKEEDETNPRRPGHEGREQHYWDQLRLFAHAAGINLADTPLSNPAPSLNLPSWADRKAVGKVLDLFGALLIRFAEDILARTHVPVLRPSASRLRATRKFQSTRINQFHYLLDRGSMTNFNLTLVPILKRHVECGWEAGWLRWLNIVELADDGLLAHLIPHLALSHTILTEGMARTAVGSVDAHNLKPVLAHSRFFKYPYGRALNAVGNINPSLSGDRRSVAHSIS